MDSNASELVWGIIVGVFVFGIIREVTRKKMSLGFVQSMCISVVAGFAVYILFMLHASGRFFDVKVDLLALVGLVFIYISTFFAVSDWERNKDKKGKNGH